MEVATRADLVGKRLGKSHRAGRPHAPSADAREFGHRRLPLRPAAEDPGRRRRDRRQDRGTRDDRPHRPLRELRTEFPPSLVDLLAIPGLGPKTVRLVYDELGIETSTTSARPRRPARSANPASGLSERTEQLILDGIAALESRRERLLLPTRPRRSSTPSSPGLEGAPGLRSDRARRLLPPSTRDHRRPRPPRRDRRPRGADRSGSRASPSSRT